MYVQESAPADFEPAPSTSSQDAQHAQNVTSINVISSLGVREADIAASSSTGQQQQQQAHRQIFLRGPRSSGKSIALASLVSWARLNDWVVSMPTAP